MTPATARVAWVAQGVWAGRRAVGPLVGPPVRPPVRPPTV